MSLNRLCIQIKLNKRGATSKLLNDKRVILVMKWAAKRIQMLNPEYSITYLESALKTIIWEVIHKHYIPTRENSRADNYVLTYISSFAKKKLGNYIGKEKNLKRTHAGYVPRLAVVRSDHMEGYQDPEPEDTLSKVTVQSALIRVIQNATKTKVLSEVDAFILALRHFGDMQTEDIAYTLLQQYNMSCTKGWISKRLNSNIYPSIRRELNRIGIKEEDVL